MARKDAAPGALRPDPELDADAAMYTPELLRVLYAHMEWADAKVWSGVLRTADARDDSWLRDKLFHMHDTQQAFLSLWTGQPRSAAKAPDRLAAVYEWARPYYATARGFLESADARALAERCVAGLAPTSTIEAAPASSK